jgi:hypothetical protein
VRVNPEPESVRAARRRINLWVSFTLFEP